MENVSLERSKSRRRALTLKDARPYHSAHQRGVKIVGATAHFVAAGGDEGPIIEQDIARVTHAHTADQ